MGITWTCRCHVPFRLNLPSTITAERWGNVCSSIQHVGSIFWVILIPFWGPGSLKSPGPKKKSNRGNGICWHQDLSRMLHRNYQKLTRLWSWTGRLGFRRTPCARSSRSDFSANLSLALVKASGRCRCRWVKGPRSLAVLTGRRLGEVRYIEPVGGTTTPPRVDWYVLFSDEGLWWIRYNLMNCFWYLMITALEWGILRLPRYTFQQSRVASRKSHPFSFTFFFQ